MKILLTITLITIIISIIYLFLIFPRHLGKADRKPFLNCHYAHRGVFDNNSSIPENSLPAFENAICHGYGIELDVQLSKDNIPVVFHDASLKRMCNVNGYVWDYTLDELKSFRLANSTQTIPTLKEALETIGSRAPIIVEYKLDKVQTYVCELSEQILKEHPVTYCIQCFHPLALIWYRKHRPDIMRGQLCMEFWKEKSIKVNPLYTPLSFLITNFLTRPDFISYKYSDYKNISRRLCKICGGLSLAWTVKTQKDFDDSLKHFDLIIFDSFVPKS